MGQDPQERETGGVDEGAGIACGVMVVVVTRGWVEAAGSSGMLTSVTDCEKRLAQRWAARWSTTGVKKGVAAERMADQSARARRFGCDGAV